MVQRSGRRTEPLTGNGKYLTDDKESIDTVQVKVHRLIKRIRFRIRAESNIPTAIKL